MMNYWANLKGHNEEKHPTVKDLNPCWESLKAKDECFVWSSNKMAKEMGLQELKYSPVLYPMTPPWMFPPVILDLYIQDEIKRLKGIGNWADIVYERLSTMYKYFIAIFTDGSKDPKSGNTWYSFIIPELEISIRERTSDNLTVFTVEMLAILKALQWVEQNRVKMAVMLR